MLTMRARAVLNVCAPYTSRDEITTAIRSTVEEYTKPLAPPQKRPFSETHIRRNIQAKQLSTVAEEAESAVSSTLSPPGTSLNSDSRTSSPFSASRTQDSER